MYVKQNDDEPWLGDNRRAGQSLDGDWIKLVDKLA